MTNPQPGDLEHDPLVRELLRAWVVLLIMGIICHVLFAIGMVVQVVRDIKAHKANGQPIESVEKP